MSVYCVCKKTRQNYSNVNVCVVREVCVCVYICEGTYNIAEQYHLSQSEVDSNTKVSPNIHFQCPLRVLKPDPRCTDTIRICVNLTSGPQRLLCHWEAAQVNA